MPRQLRNLKINLSILTKREEKKNKIKNQQHMNSNLTSSSSRTHEHKPIKSNTRTQENQTQKIINEYPTKQNQSTYIHKPNYPKEKKDLNP